MKKAINLLVGIILSLMLMGSQVKQQPDQLLFDVVRKMDVTIDGVVYHYGSRVSGWMLTKRVDRFVNQLAKELNCTSIRHHQDSIGVHYRAEQKNSNFHTKLYVVNDQPDQVWSKPYISIQLIGAGGWEMDSISMYQQLEKILAKFHLPLDVHFVIQGSRPVEKGSVKGLVEQALQMLQAKEIEGIHSPQMISSSAISTLLPHQGLQTRRGRMNVQVATKLDPNRNKLLFTIGLPIITIEY